MSLTSKIRTIFRGDLAITDLPRELVRRKRAADRQRHERRELEKIGSSPSRLLPEFASLTDGELLGHFRLRKALFFDTVNIAGLQRELFQDETKAMIAAADRIVHESAWDLAGFGVLSFDREARWRSDPLTGSDWGLDYHADIVPYHEGGPDIRVLWEVNRFGHAITLARAFAVTGDESYAEAFFSQVAEWMQQNPYGRGANWHCAMEAALRAINLLAAFDIFRHSERSSKEQLGTILQLLDQHGKFILDNNEFSYVATSNHYLSNAIGLFWIGTMLPELQNAAEWQAFGLSEMLREMDKQVLPDGADFESSTGYHRFVTEMFLLSFLLAQKNGVDIPQKYWGKLQTMLEYLHGITRTDGRIPLIGDADGSQIIPIVKRYADDAAYLLALGAVVLDNHEFKSFASLTPEVLWSCGENGADKFNSLAAPAGGTTSAGFPNAGSYVMRSGDLYLHFNANDCGVNGRGSHAHNDALSIEVSAFGRPFIVDPGNYAYNLDRTARHKFRSTAYHSTVSVDAAEQNSIAPDLPFIMGNEAKPRVLSWETDDQTDRVVAEHDGFMRLNQQVRHRRTVEFNKIEQYWVIDDHLEGQGDHVLAFRFHLAPGLDVQDSGSEILCIAVDKARCLYIQAIGFDAGPVSEPAFVSRNYGHMESSTMLKWQLEAAMPFSAKFVFVPSGPDDNRESRLELVARLTDNK